MSSVMAKREIERSLSEYEAKRKGLLEENPEFARWLREEYVPIAGGWMY